MYVKLIDGKIENAPKVLRDDKNTYANPLPETLVAFGYKPVVEQERPEDKEGFYQVSHYEENDSEIILVWEYIEIPVEEPVVEEPVIEEPVIEEVNENAENVDFEEPEVNENAESVAEENSDTKPTVEEESVEESISETEMPVEETEEPVEK